MSNTVLAWTCWLVACFLLGRAVHYWQEAAKIEGYDKAYKEIGEIQDQKIIARRLAETMNVENEAG